MRSIIVRHYGGPEALELHDSATPEPGPDELRIAVRAAAVNPVDIATRAGWLDAYVAGRLPVGLGWDVAGTVDAVGADVAGFALGDAVLALIDSVVVTSGAYATHAVVPAAAVAHAPRDVAFEAAATLPLNGQTAGQALDLLDLPAGATLLVTGAAGAVGEFTVTLAARRGLRVVGLARATDEDTVRGAGASGFTTSLDTLTEPVDGVLDAAGLGKDALRTVRDGGVFVAVSDPGTPDAERDVRVDTVHVHHDGAQLTELVRLVEDGPLRLRVAGTLPLSDAATAHERVAAGGLRGRIVLLP